MKMTTNGIKILDDCFFEKFRNCSLKSGERFFLFLLLMVLLIPKLNANFPVYPSYLQFKNITSIDGLSNNCVYHISQDRDGYIWIATHEGLNRFDGRSIQTYYHTQSGNSIPGNFVTQLLSTSEGALIVGTNHGASIYDKERDLFTLIDGQDSVRWDVLRIIELSNKNILIATGVGLYSITVNFKVQKISNIYYRDLCEYKNGVVWAAYENEIHLLNAEGQIIKLYNNNMVARSGFDFSSRNINCIYKDSRDRIWIGTMRNGLGYYKADTDEFIFLQSKKGVNPIEDNFIRVINEDKDGRLWVGTESGLYIYDVHKQEFSFYGQSFNPLDKGLNDKAIYSIFRSTDQVMWVGTYFGGVNYTSPYSKGFVNMYADGGINRLSGNAVSEIIETRDGKLWMATEDGGITIFNPTTSDFSYLKHRIDNPNTLSSNNVHALEEDANGDIWIGTFIGGLNKYIKSTGNIEHIVLNHPDKNLVQSVFSITIDHQQRIWVAAISGLYLKMPGSNQFNMFIPEAIDNLFFYHVGEDFDGNIWVCSYFNGIYKIDQNLRLTNYNTDKTPQLKSNQIIYFYNDSRNVLWFGTTEGGLLKYNPADHSFKSFTVENGLPNNTVYAITEDKPGNIWFTTNKGITMLNPVNEKFRNYSQHDGLIGNQYNYKSGLATSDGLIYFGAVNGLTYFNPVNLMINYQQPILHFTDFKLFNNSLSIGDRDILQSHIDSQQKLKLKYNYNVFTIEFIGLNYLLPENNRYAYYLEGFENDWNLYGTQNSATYTNLSPGKYTFHVKVANGEGIWSDSERTLEIRILPPFWLSVWGFLLYFIIFSSLLYLYWYYSMIRHQEKLKMQMATLEKQKNEEVTQHRLNFFTYISHEFKTPLTIVIATIEQFLTHEEMLPQLKDYGLLIKKNALRLLFLINQLMDFRKIETDHASLKLNKGDLIGFLKSTFETFYLLMQKKSLTANFTSNLDRFTVYFDPDKIEKIVTNLISNACNSFEKPGSVSLDVNIVENIGISDSNSEQDYISHMVMTVKDNGPGLSPTKLKQVFDPFYSEGLNNVNRSGIGLALVKSLVNLLNGQIHISSEPKSGTTVIIQLPLLHNPPKEFIQNDQFIASNDSFKLENSSINLDSDQPLSVFGHTGDHNTVYELMVVEDNRDLSAFLVQHFSRYYKVSQAYDGEEALMKIVKSQPDLIISDIMMPRMDGFALCSTLKNAVETSHIPVILLTAKSGFDSKLQGLDYGADAYIDKPFNLRELELTVRNILRSRENIRVKFSKFDSLSETVNQLCNKDQQFIEKLTGIIYEHLDDVSFNVDLFCREVLISRTLLHVKLKKITGLSTTEFVKNVRLNEAKKLLLTGEYTVSEVAYKVGFSDPAYFSKSFKKTFDVSPSVFHVDPNDNS
jgi:ligand-binding sensor domain-containing protein/signal transduction histidine kinase/AraC-like DNA-binding protein